MRFKYVMMSRVRGETEQRVPVIFPEVLNHSDVASALQFRDPYLRGCPVASAGFLNVTHDGRIACHGRSESLGIGSHPDDARIIETYNYLHGLVPAQSKA